MSQTRKRSPAQLLGIAALAVALAGCTTFSRDGGFGEVERATRERLGKDVAWSRSETDRETVAGRVAELLAQPLSVDDAVQVALLSNRGLQAAFYELGISEAELVQAGRFPNPHFSMLRASRPEAGGRDYKIEQALTFNVFALVTIPQAVAIERRRFEATQRAVILETLRLGLDTRKAWFEAVAAEESVRYMRQVKAAAEAAAELGRRLAEAGNWNRLQQAREQGFYADAALGLARAEQAQVATRERLTRLLGLWGAQAQYRLPERLPELPKAADDLPEIEQTALAQRLDLQAIKLETEALAKNLGLTKTTRFINVLEFGPARVLEGRRGEGYRHGYELSFELPLFDWGGAKVARAEALYMQALNQAAQVAVDARSQVREAYNGYRNGYDIAKHWRDEIVPVRKRIADENLLRYNGMLIGVFELLADARAQIASVAGSIEALRDFWIAKADLDQAMIGTPDLRGVTALKTTAPATAAEH